MGSRFSSSLPEEILVNILLLLLPVDIHSVSRVNRHLRTLVLSSPTLQHHVLLRESGYEHTLYSGIHPLHRIAALKRDRMLWSGCRIAETAALFYRVGDLMKREALGLLTTSLKQGLYLVYRKCRYIQEPKRDDLYIFQINHQCIDCGKKEGVKLTHARTIPFDPMRRGFCFDRDRHNLLATVTLETNTDNQTLTYAFTLRLRQLSDNKVHPSAASADVIIAKGTTHPLDHSSLIEMQACLDIAGNHILVLLTWRDRTLREPESVYDQLILVDWVNGQVLARDQTARDGWPSFALLSNDTIALANKVTGTLDIVKFPISRDDDLSNTGVTEDAPPKFIRLLSLKFPNRLVDNTEVLFKFTVIASTPNASNDERKFANVGRSPFVSSLESSLLVIQFRSYRYQTTANEVSFVIRRSGLLDIIATCNTVPSTPQTLEWPSWGPSNSQVFQRQRKSKFSICGQRIIFFIETRRDRGQIVVCDFNAYEIRRVEKASLSTDDKRAAISRGCVVRKKRLDQRYSLYKDEVETSLPYVETRIDSLERNVLLDDGIVLYERYDQWGNFIGKIAISTSM